MEYLQQSRLRPGRGDAVELIDRTVIWRCEDISAAERWLPFEEMPSLANYITKGCCVAEDVPAMVRRVGPLFLRPEGAPRFGPFTYEESVDRWVDEVDLVSRTLSLQTAVAERDSQALASVFSEEVARALGVDDQLSFAGVTLGTYLEAGFRGHVAPHVEFRDGVLRVGLLGEDLLGDVWLLVARQLTGDLVLKECENPTCNNMFVVEPRHPKQQFCSTRCRVDSFRKQKGGETK